MSSFIENLESIFIGLGKPIDDYNPPTIEEINAVRPDVYQSYVAKADSKHLVLYNPYDPDCDEWGMLIFDVIAVTKRLGKTADKRPRVITDSFGEDFKAGGCFYISDKGYDFDGWIKQYQKALEVNEGCEFRGWNNTKQYRLSAEETKELIGGKIIPQAPEILPWERQKS